MTLVRPAEITMSFGFSAGDFIAALELVATVIDALRESGGASSEYREIIRQLYSLETALISVKRLEVDPAQNAELISLRQAAAQCQRTIDDFWKKMQKYQPHLRAGGSTSRLKDGWMKIQWAKCKKEDVARFKADLVGHTESIQLLLMAMQMASASLHEKRHDQQAHSLAGKVQDSYFGCMQRLSSITESLQSGFEQGKKILEMTAKVMQTNIQVFQAVLDIQMFTTRIPGQIDRQQQVYFIDALGRTSMFDLGFVRSSEALISVLKSNFKKVGHAREMIKRGDFVIQDSATKKDVNLEMDWDLCFSPGQRVEMSMVFKRPTRPTNNCPTCKADCGKSTEEDTECPKCGLNFRRILDLEHVPDNVSNTSLTNRSPGLEKPPNMFGPSLPRDSMKRKHGGNQEEIDEISLFRRVRLYNSMHRWALPDLPPPDFDYRTADDSDTLSSFFDYQATVYTLRNNDWDYCAFGFVHMRPERKAGQRIEMLCFRSIENVVFSPTRPTLGHGFRKQQHHLIVWTADSGAVMAFNFQPAFGCLSIWDNINKILENRNISF